MSPTKQYPAPGASRAWPGLTGLAAVALGAMLGTAAHADMYHPSTNAPGGVPAQSTITSMVKTPTNATLCWYGMQGWYSVESAPDIAGPWTSVGRALASDFSWCLTVTNTNGLMAMFRLNQTNAYVGSGGCAGCHGDKYTEWSGTGHSHAYSDLHALHLPPAVEASCLVCHTVGYGQPTGFRDITNTPYLTDVGCENCHGPAAWHKYSDHDLVHPAVSIDPKICGGCHSGDFNPQYDEYKTTLHAQVNDDVKYGFNSGVYYTNTLVTSSNTWYGYYVTTNKNGTLKTNATTGIIYSFYGPANNPVYDQGQDRQVGCGICHSGAARMAMLNDYEARQAGITNPLALPTGSDAGLWGPTCAVCHDPHDDYNVAQLRNPTRSTNYFSMATTADKRTVRSTNWNGTVTTNVYFMGTTFASLYDPNIQVCGQCHNTRGARWDGRAYGLMTNNVTGTATNMVTMDIVTNIYTTNIVHGVTYVVTNTQVIGRTNYLVVSTVTNPVISVGLTANITGFSRAPHNSVQYNMLIGILQPDYLTTNSLGVATNYTARHSGFTGKPYNTNQCATCHMPSYAVNSETNVTGHTFELNTLGCALGGCHLSGVPDIGGTQVTTTNNLSNLVDLLNQWATNSAPAILGASDYNISKQNSWEYTAPGSLASVTNAGPAATNQVKLPPAILQARFNAYMVRNDGSLGVHNPGYTRFLLADAENKVLGQFGVARFRANTPTVWVNTAVTFTNLNPAAATCSWDFGDSGTADSLGPVAHSYASPGTYTVKLTTTDTNNVTQTLTRDNYINVYPKPVPSFTYGPATGSAPLTVSFTNTSVNATYYRWTFMNGVSGSPFSNDVNPAPFTYTNAGTYQARLSAYNPGGNISVTNTITVNP